MTALTTLIDPLKRELAVPGTFDSVFPDTSDEDLAGSLADGFGEARLRGFFPHMTIEDEPGYETSEDLSEAGGAIITIFASMRIIRAQIRAFNTVERYKAGPAEFELQKAATVLKAELDFLQKRLDDIIKTCQAAARPLASVFDNYLARSAEMLQMSGLHSYEYRG